jgi:hypothetical protein
MHYQAYFIGSDVAQRWRTPLSNTHAPVGVFQAFYLMMQTDAVIETILKFIYFLNIEEGVVLNVMHHHQNPVQLVLDLLYAFNLVNQSLLLFIGN